MPIKYNFALIAWIGIVIFSSLIIALIIRSRVLFGLTWNLIGVVLNVSSQIASTSYSVIPFRSGSPNAIGGERFSLILSICIGFGELYWTLAIGSCSSGSDCCTRYWRLFSFSYIIISYLLIFSSIRNYASFYLSISCFRNISSSSFYIFASFCSCRKRACSSFYRLSFSSFSWSWRI